MDTVRINQIKCYAYHGCIDEEAQAGGYFTVDIEVSGNWRTAAATDQLSDAVDYVALSEIAVEEMKIRAALIEQVAYRIADRIQEKYPSAERTRVSITKLRAPIELDVDSVTVSVEI